jgi:predicted nucleotidyltransferase
MRTDLDHLTVAKRQELARVVSILFDAFDRALAGRKAPHCKSARILKVVLFGSYARDDWVIDPIGGYFSDFDILVVVNHEEQTDMDYWQAAEDHLLRELEAGGPIRTQVNLIVHSLADMNTRLRRGRAFFVDIVRDGIALHDTPDHPSTRRSRCRPMRRSPRRRGTSTSGLQVRQLSWRLLRT